jgi:hypothetical protein
MGETNLLGKLDQSTSRYRETEKAHDESREAVIADVVAALRGGERPTDVANHSPFTASYVRKIAREHGIEDPRGTPDSGGARN